MNTNTNEQYLGDNLNRARERDTLILDGRERGNPSARTNAEPGTYRVTRTSGAAPGDVGYYGVRIS